MGERACVWVCTGVTEVRGPRACCCMECPRIVHGGIYSMIQVAAHLMLYHDTHHDGLP